MQNATPTHHPTGVTNPKIRRLFTDYLISALFGIVAIYAARLVAMRSIDRGATIISVTAISSIQDVMTYTFIMTFFLMLYTVGLLATRRSIARVGKFVIVTLILEPFFNCKTASSSPFEENPLCPSLLSVASVISL